MLEKAYSESELIFGLIGAVGTELRKVRELLEDRLRVIGYRVVHVKITRDVIPRIVTPDVGDGKDEFERTMGLMNAGNDARERSGDNSVLALGAAAFINAARKNITGSESQPAPKHAFIISSLKHPEEVNRLREIYPQGFHLIGVHADPDRRLTFLTRDERISNDNARRLIKRDEEEAFDHGQKVIDTFHLSDFFLRIEEHDTRLKESVWRVLDLLFGNPYKTPTFDEYAMFLAFTASLRSYNRISLMVAG